MATEEEEVQNKKKSIGSERIRAIKTKHTMERTGRKKHRYSERY